MPNKQSQWLPIGVCVRASVEQNKKLNKRPALRVWAAEGSPEEARGGIYPRTYYSIQFYGACGQVEEKRKNHHESRGRLSELRRGRGKK